MTSITETLKQQIKTLQAELDNPKTDEARKLEIQKHIEENKNLLETTYKDLNKRNGVTLREFEKMVDAKGNPIKRATGIALIDEVFDGGFEEGMFINLVGESGAGKSTIALEILLNIAEFNKSVFIGLEMGDKLTLKKIRQYGISEAHRDNLIIDIHSRDIEIVKREISLYANDGVKFFVIDSKMKLETTMKADEYKKISYISGELSKLTQQLGIIIILINQISEENLKHNRVSLKGSGDQIYDSDIVLVYKKVKDLTKREMLVYKNRQNNKEGITIQTELRDNRTVSTKKVEVREYKEDKEFLRSIV